MLVTRLVTPGHREVHLPGVSLVLSPEPVPEAWECRAPTGQPEGGVNPKKSFRPRVWDMRFTKVWKDRTNCVSCGDWRVTPVSGGSEGGLDQLCQTGFPLVAAQVS